MLEYCQVWRVRFGKENESYSSELIVVQSESELEEAIIERQKQLKDCGTIIDSSVFEIKGLRMTPDLFTPNKEG